MTSNFEKNIEELRHLDYDMDTDGGNAAIGDIVAEACRLFPNDFMRALEHAEDGRYGLMSKGEFPDAGDSNVRDVMTETLRMFCTPLDPQEKFVPAGLFQMNISEIERALLENFTSSDMDNEHEKDKDQGLRMELDESLNLKLQGLKGKSDMVLVMTPGEVEVAAMLTANWHLGGGSDDIWYEIYAGDDSLESSEDGEGEGIARVDEAIARLYARFFPSQSQVIVL